MKKTKTEIKIWRKLFLSFGLFYMILILNSYVLQLFNVNPYYNLFFGLFILISVAIIIFQSYSLGWEYKKIQMMEEESD